jgi:hypothetical protein
MAQGFKTGGRKKGSRNKVTTALKEAILRAAELAGNEEGLIGYLRIQATANPGPFMALLGKVLPMQVEGSEDAPVIHEIRQVIIYPEADREDRQDATPSLN